MVIINKPIAYHRLNSKDVLAMRKMNAMFGRAFDDEKTYLYENGTDEYFQKILSQDHIIALSANVSDQVIGGLVAYRLDKLESARSEVYIYDLAVDNDFRRQGIATGLISELKTIAKNMGAWAVFVQADKVDEPAVALYEKLGIREEPYHYDLHLDN